MGQLIDHAKYEAATRGFNAIFNRALEQTPYVWKEIATRVQSEGSSETYNWAGSMPGMKKWIGDRQFEELRAHGMEVRNEDWSVGIRIAANDIDDDRLGITSSRVEALAERGRQHQDELVIGMLNAGFAATMGLAEDGQFWLDTDHSTGGSPSQSNKGTAVLDATAFDAAVTAMMKIKDERGKPLNIRPTHLVVPPDLRAVGRGIVEAEQLSGGATNINAGSVKMLVSPFLTSATAWFLLDASRSLRPLILQERRPLNVVEQADPQSEGMFNRREIRLAADWRGNATFGPWQLAWGSTGAGS